MSEARPVGGRLLTIPTLVLAALAAVAGLILAKRFALGLGAVTHLNGGYPWGLWVVADIVIGTAFACGGYVVAFTVYVLNKGRYHPLVRPALLASLLGYGLGGAAAFIDMGRYGNFYNMFLPWQVNVNSVMLEVGLCVFTYVLVLAVEFLPVVAEAARWTRLRRRLERWLFLFIALGLVLPTMHQSSLGSLLISAGYKIHPLWQSMALQPFFALLTAILMGLAIVIFESAMAAAGLRHELEKPLLTGFGRGALGLTVAYLALRLGDLAMRGALGDALAGDLRGNLFLLETALFVFPVVVLAGPLGRRAPWLFLAALSLGLAGALYRLNAFLIGFLARPGYVYFPSAEEILVTVGLVAFEILVYLVAVKRLPVLAAPARAA
ncbi:Ni/Fe-hydrogenase cytochrome b subunit [Inmirania thermothiophila]|uniref:Ni/Fe-hydrogenase subunit HybB-like protein n=1 Tax=Inmirania thermothiophila TaxID=1750597 RepID=A0A3N1Y127_9GAMM|nr:Ni/Fe-hydrogenase cytochrome b subunit [Inmirania thermothiophila]ROR32539.1 Ni/Fe-hydrogenase subunit HybB-like protein [Inmirania thermothiophila]